MSALVKHAPSVGTFHENIVSNYLENFLSRRFSIRTGFVFNTSNGLSSSQIDILIIDENIPSAYLFKDKDFVVAMPESVVCAIEIKTNFGKKEFMDISKKSKQYRETNLLGHNLIALCFNSKVKSIETLSNWFKEVNCINDWKYYPQEIVILNDCIIKSLPEQLAKPGGACRIVCNEEVEEKEEALLTYFLFSIMKLCELKSNVRTDKTISTIFAGDFDGLFQLKHKSFQYGVGMVDLDELNNVDGTSIYKRSDKKL